MDRRQAYVLAVIYLAGTSVGAAAVGAIAGLLGEFIHLPRLLGPVGGFASVALVAILALAADFRLPPLPPLYLRRQVPSIWWTRRRRGVTALMWGVQLGVAPLTYMPSAVFYLLLWCALLLGPLLGAVALAGYGVARGINLVLVLLRSNAGRLRDEAFPDATGVMRVITASVALIALMRGLT
ncbi:MAG: hypothetical protein AABM40_04375 [Chloroflexota bacterium]